MAVVLMGVEWVREKVEQTEVDCVKLAQADQHLKQEKNNDTKFKRR